MGDEHGWHTGKEQRIDPKRTMRVKPHHRWKAACISPEFAAEFDRIFSTPSVGSGNANSPAEPEPTEEQLRRKAYRDNFDLAFGAK